MKVALLYSGLVRTIQETWPSAQSSFAQYAPDIYCFLNEPDQERTVRDLLQPRLLVAEADSPLPEKEYHSRLGPGVNALQNDLRQLHGLLRVNQLCNSSGIAYDWIARLRTDLLFTRPPEPLGNLSPHAIYIPRFSNWIGYNDRFAMGPPHLMNIYMDRFTGFDAYFNRGGVFQMESYLAWCLRKHEVPVARTVTEFDTLRAGGTRDEPYRHHGWGDIL